MQRFPSKKKKKKKKTAETNFWEELCEWLKKEQYVSPLFLSLIKNQEATSQHSESAEDAGEL